MQDIMDVLDEMEGHDFLKIIGGSVAGVGLIAALPVFGAFGTVTAGGAILGSLLGAGAGVAVVASDEEERKQLRRMADDIKDSLWSKSVVVRKELAECACTVDGYYQAVKLVYALAAAATEAGDTEDGGAAQITKGTLDSAAFQQDPADEDIDPVRMQVKEALDGMFAVWLPQALKDDLSLAFEHVPTFYEAELMIREAFKQGNVDAVKFIEAATGMLEYLDAMNLIGKGRVEDEWNAFKAGVIARASEARAASEEGCRE